MVYLNSLMRTAIGDSKKFQKSARISRFIDSLLLYVRGGPGGMGLPKYGGTGGDGGNVVVKCVEGVTMKDVKSRYPGGEIKASSGEHSHSRCILGRRGNDHVIHIPVGVTVIDNHKRIIGELNRPGEKLIVAKGGLGGREETGFSGIKGEGHCVRLDLKLIADIGLVGFPNAGKSTFLKAITRANPKIASYPFTTIKPNVGILKYADLRTLSIADLPGLVEGAHKNIGMGHRFLRHVERTKLLLIVADINGFRLGNRYDHRTCLDTIVLLNKELELYKEYLVEKPALALINKMDTEGAQEKFDSIQDKLYNLGSVLDSYPEEVRPNKPIVFDHVLPISAKTSAKDIQTVKEVIRQYLDMYAEKEFEDAEMELWRRIQWKQEERGVQMT